MNQSSVEATSPVIDEVMCIADTKWVLGHWYIKVMRNGRSLTDFNALAAMAQDQLGHTRAFFSLLEQSQGFRQNQLEFERARDQIRSMALLDDAPSDWADFIVGAALSELALQVRLKMIDGDDNAISMLARQCHDECDFHVLYFDGSLQALTPAEQQQGRIALARRFPLALQWFGDEATEANARQGFVAACESTIASRLGCELPNAEMKSAPGSWDAVRRRPKGSSMPTTLWEFILPTNEQAVMCRRPLVVSSDDGIRFSGAA